MFLKVSEYSQKTPLLDSLFDKVAGLEVCDVIPTQVFSYGYCEFFKRTLFFTEDLRWLLLKKLKVRTNVSIFLPHPLWSVSRYLYFFDIYFYLDRSALYSLKSKVLASINAAPKKKKANLSIQETLLFSYEFCLRPATWLKKRLRHRCFPVNFAKFWRTLFWQNTSGRLLLVETHSKNDEPVKEIYK